MAPHFVDDQYRRLFDFFQLQAAKKEELRGRIELAPKVTAVNGTAATVEDCFDDHELGSYKVGTDERTDPVTLERTWITAELKLDGASWKVAKVTPEGSGCQPG